MAASGQRRPSDITLARIIAEAVRQVPGVARISAPGVAAATYGVGTEVSGIAVRRVDAAVAADVHVTAVYQPELDLPELARRVRGAVVQALKQHGVGPIGQVDVVIDDLEVGSQHT
ncbi:MAG TPA: Asp23/Gls24 family envelope stress response protein [Thermomicrobiaceae bacterium]|nr:Asp23/Gls24 family envelope stress response protein [Thermomicrobiaceae bacterium]